MAIIILPIAVLASFLIMYRQGISSNIMSLGGIAIAIGAMVDAVIIMIENAHKHIERDGGKKPHWEIIRDASIEVGPTLFYSLLVITVSFIPVFTLQAQEGRLFKPLAFTKTYSMAAAALLSITLAPVLMGYFIRGKIPPEEKNPINRFLIWLYHPCIDFVIKWRWPVIVAAVVIVGLGLLPVELARHRRGCRMVRPRASPRRSEGHFPFNISAPSSCRRSTKAICSTCRRRSPASRRPRRAKSSSRPTRSSRASRRCITSSEKSGAPRPPPTPLRST